MKRFLQALLLSFGLAGSLHAQVVPIANLHHNNSDGTPAAPYQVGTQVTVSGVVTVGTGVLATTHFEIYLQDETGGICVYNPTLDWSVQTGDSVTVTGPIAQYNGLTEIKQPSTLIDHGPAVVQPVPLDLTCHDVSAAFQADGSEPNESRLIRLRKVVFRSTGSNVGFLLDSTGSCKIYFDADAKVSPPQSGDTVDVVGILKQWDSSAPYTEGYEIVPRSPADIAYGAGPRIVRGPVETDIQPDAVEISWETDVPSEGTLEYGRTASYELGQIPSSGGETTRHTVRITGLTAATTYHCRVVATNEEGSSYSDDLLFCTASPSEATGRIYVYFNQSVDTTKARGEKARGRVNLSSVLAQRIGQAQHSVDACFYVISDDAISGALIGAFKRGVSVRVIVEHDNIGTEVRALKNNGVPVIDDTFGENDGGGQMHNKFVVIDARDRSSAADDWVWTGSYNATYAGATENAENAVLIQDQALALAYTREFDEMWGASGDTPNPDSSRFGSRKRDNTPHRFNIGGTWVEAYFSPSDATTSHLIEAIDSADRSALFCIYSFTRNDVSAAFRAKWEGVQPFTLAGVFEGDNVNQPGSEWGAMSGTGSGAWSRPADVHRDLPTRLLHHKYLIVDGLLGTAPDPLVVTGSHNWTTAAETRNDENMLILHSARVANLYLQEFAMRYRESGGKDATITAVEEASSGRGTPRAFTLTAEVYPSPAHGATSIRVLGLAPGRSVRLRLVDVRGRVLRTWRVRGQAAWETLWDGKDSRGRPVASGVLFVVAESGDQRTVRRFVWLR
ncbi:MAG: hypothetical protein GXO73_01120 [Calditrichaeota bacterium]|nr:hypothetical protein [Calditrichota bacterium]